VRAGRSIFQAKDTFQLAFSINVQCQIIVRNAKGKKIQDVVSQEMQTQSRLPFAQRTTVRTLCVWCVHNYTITLFVEGLT
jgi:hypothetical protein